MATVAPMPSARHAIADTATVGALRRLRAAMRTSVSSGVLMAAPSDLAWRQHSDRARPAEGWIGARRPGFAIATRYFGNANATSTSLLPKDSPSPPAEIATYC